MQSIIKNPSSNLFDRDQLNRQIAYNQDTFQKHFNDRLQTRNEFYDRYNEIIHQKWEQFMEDKGLDIYQRELINENTIPQNLIIKPDQISPLLNSVEQENQTLRIEVKHLAQDLRKQISMVELLLEENRYVRDKLQVTNEDMNKIIEVVGINEKEENSDLKLKIEVLTEENGLLQQKLEELSGVKRDFKLLQERHELEIARAKEVFERCNADKEIALKMEEQLSKQVQTLEMELEESQRGNQDNEFRKNQLQKDLDQKNFDFTELQKQFDKVNTQFQDLQRNSQQEIDQLNIEIDSVNDRIIDFQSQVQPLRDLNQKYQTDLNNILKENQSVKMKYENSKIEIEKYLNLLQNEENKQKAFHNQILELQQTIAENQEKSQFSEQQKNHMEDQLNQFIDQKQKELQKVKTNLERDKNSLTKQVNQEREDRISQTQKLNDQIDQLEHQIRQNSRVVQIKENEISDLKRKTEQIKSLHKQVDDLNQALNKKDQLISKIQDNLQMETSENSKNQAIKEQYDTLEAKYQDLEEQFKEMEQQFYENQQNQELDEARNEITELTHKIYQIQHDKEQLQQQLNDKTIEHENYIIQQEQNKISGMTSTFGKTTKFGRKDEMSMTNIPNSTAEGFGVGLEKKLSQNAPYK